ncbi:ComEC/Rec2 family competence protein [Terrarubrum flagellatum]|uniref:ComEC/Rec2 family competence protein n=1 Tax=Terrirubrum flagellatum TaxID=2895980 RepID=UPI003145611A
MKGRAQAKAIAAAAGRARRDGVLWPFLLGLLADGWSALVGWLAADAAERRLFLWLPVAMGAGVILYFAADGEPAMVAPVIGCAIFATIAFVVRGQPVAFPVCVGLAAVFAGFLSASWRAARVAAPRIERITTAAVTGYIEVLDRRPDGARILLRVSSIEGLKPEQAPYRIRVTTKQPPTAQPGDLVKFGARLLPPPEPPRPGAYDFGRDAYFKGIGGVGSAPGAVGPAIAGPPPPWDVVVFAAIDRKRNELTDRMVRAIGGQAGALAAALVTGKRDLISDQTNDALRAAGVYHIVSVSGLHMVLAAGAFFWAARAILALIPAIALAWPVKKIGAVLAMIGATAYCLFTGSEVATERSLIMILVMLGAVLADRPALAMRNLAVSALITLAREPETLTGPSFQMSYAAVAGLVALAEWQRDRASSDERDKQSAFATLSSHVWLWLAGLFVTTIVATLATAPYSAFHFQRLNPWGLIGNTLALPFVSFIVMPAAVVGVLLWPFGLDGWVWTLMGWGTAPVITVSQAVANLQGSVTALRAFGPAAVLLTTLALVWFVIWRTPLRWAAIAPALVGAILMTRGEPVDFFIARGGQGAAFRGADNRLVILGDASRFDVGFWLQADGDLRGASEPSLKTGVKCDRLGCTGADRAGRTIVWIKDERAFPEDCRRAHFIITRLAAPGWCNDPLIADRKTSDDYGAMVVKFRGDEPDVIGVRSPDTRRPWQAPLRTANAAPAPPPAAVETPQRPATTPRPRSRDPTPEHPEDGDPDQ